MSTFLLEIGIEDLPADFARSVNPQLKKIVETDLRKSRLSYEVVSCTSTPRRIALTITDLPQKAEDYLEERKGPPAASGFNNGDPTPAAIGFAKKYGVKTKDLLVRDTPKGPFVFANICHAGDLAENLLINLIPEWIGNLQGKRFMRWGSGDLRFSRPIRWVVCMIDKKKLSLQIQGVDPLINSENLTRGHRLYQYSLPITSASEYFDLLREVGVIVERNERCKLIKELINESALGIDAYPDIPSNLLEELADLVESPSLIKGSFDKTFLDLPPEVLITVMQVHQRYIPLYSQKSMKDPLALNAKNSLLSSFLCISNGLPKASELIKKGNERVLKARFSDAKFFWNIDVSISSENRLEDLSKVTFAAGLGTLLNRVERIEWLARKLSEFLDLSEPNSEYLIRAAHFCKHDLVSQMVGEFPELQGVMGGKYLLYEGEPREVALAVLEHYLPRSSGDTLPESIPGSILAIAERLELLVSIFSKGERPTGSSDPYALRRAANGVLQIIWEKEITLDMVELLTDSSTYWSSLFPMFETSASKLLKDLLDFFRQRVVSLLEESGIDQDLVQAVAGKMIDINDLLVDPKDVYKRAKLLAKMRKSGKLQGVQAVVTRAARLADKSNLNSDVLSSSNVVNSNLFEKECEYEMLETLDLLEPLVTSSDENRYEIITDKLISSAEILSKFFDGEGSVMVMVENKMIRENRLNLLAVLRNQSYVIADFSVIN